MRLAATNLDLFEIGRHLINMAAEGKRRLVGGADWRNVGFAGVEYAEKRRRCEVFEVPLAGPPTIDKEPSGATVEAPPFITRAFISDFYWIADERIIED